MEQQLLQAVSAHYNAKILRSEANLINYFKNPVAVGEHPDVVAELITQLDQISAARGSLEILNNMMAPVEPAPAESEEEK